MASTGILYAPERDVVAFLRYNPESLMRGLSRLEPLNATLLNEDAARRANKSVWEKGVRPGTAHTHPHTVTQPAMDRNQANAEARQAADDKAHREGARDAGRTDDA